MRSVESATASIHGKRSLLLPRRGGSSLIDESPLDVSGHAISKKAADELDPPASSKALKYMEKVRYLESEMERARGGVKLLGRSVERLHEAVALESRWCGGAVSDVVSFVMGSCLRTATVKNEYSSVQMQSMDDSSHSYDSSSNDRDSDHGDTHGEDDCDAHVQIHDFHSNSKQ